MQGAHYNACKYKQTKADVSAQFPFGGQTMDKEMTKPVNIITWETILCCLKKIFI